MEKVERRTVYLNQIIQTVLERPSKLNDNTLDESTVRKRFNRFNKFIKIDKKDLQDSKG